MLTASVPTVVGGVMTGTSVVTGPSQEVTNTLYISVQCVWTGTPTGVFKIQACNDQKITSSSVWSDLSSTTSLTLNGSQPAGSSADCMFNNNATGVPWGWVRLVYTNASGSGTFNATIFTKGA